jgi:hypothetical protein
VPRPLLGSARASWLLTLFLSHLIIMGVLALLELSRVSILSLDH